jgi:hypothetical protein
VRRRRRHGFKLNGPTVGDQSSDGWSRVVAGGSTAGGSIAGGSIAGGSIAGGSIAGGSIAGGSIAGGSIADGSIAGDGGATASPRGRRRHRRDRPPAPPRTVFQYVGVEPARSVRDANEVGHGSRVASGAVEQLSGYQILKGILTPVRQVSGGPARLARLRRGPGRGAPDADPAGRRPYRRDVTPTAGYSGIPLARKLGVKPGHRLVLWSAPPGWAVPDLPEGVQLVADGGADGGAGRAGGTGGAEGTGATGGAEGAGPARGVDVCVAFCRSPAQLHAAVAAYAEPIWPAGALWIAWPRKAAGHRSDVTENLVRDTALPLGLVDVKVAALDADWSALKLVWRRERRTAR